MYIKLGRLNIQLPTSDPKSANSRYFQGHQLINPYFYHKVSRQMVVIIQRLSIWQLQYHFRFRW